MHAETWSLEDIYKENQPPRDESDQDESDEEVPEEVLAQNKLINNKADTLREKAYDYMHLAYKGGNKKAGIKIAVREGRTDKSLRNKNYLIAALLGSSTGQLVMMKTLLEMLLPITFTPNISSYGPDTDIDALIKLGNTWPGAVRNSLLTYFRRNYKNPVIRLPLLELQAIAEGREVDNFLGKSVILKWPEAYEHLGEMGGKLEYFEKPLKIKLK